MLRSLIQQAIESLQGPFISLLNSLYCNTSQLEEQVAAALRDALASAMASGTQVL